MKTTAEWINARNAQFMPRGGKRIEAAKWTACGILLGSFGRSAAETCLAVRVELLFVEVRSCRLKRL